MLFSGSSPTKPIKDKRERKTEKGLIGSCRLYSTLFTDNTTEVRDNVFTRWANSLFEAESITDLKDIISLSFLQAFAKLVVGAEIVCFFVTIITSNSFQPPTGNRFDDIDAIVHTLAVDEEDKIFQLSIVEVIQMVALSCFTFYVISAMRRQSQSARHLVLAPRQLLLASICAARHGRAQDRRGAERVVSRSCQLRS